MSRDNPDSWVGIVVDNDEVSDTNPLPVSAPQEGDWSFTPNRPSDKDGRTYVSMAADAVTGDTQIFNVPADERLYVSAFVGSMFNSSTAASGHVRIRDGGAGGTVRASFVLPTGVVGALAPHIPFSITFPEPLRFNDDVFIDIVTGTITISLALTGYREADTP